MKILFIAPIPPPTDGQSKASKVLLDRLFLDKHEVTIINLTKKENYKGYISIFKRAINILHILCQVFIQQKNKDLVYLSLAESKLGNLRDLFVYVVCYRKLKNVFVHMLGGAGMKVILEKNGLRKYLNHYFLNKIAGVIVEGPVNVEVFSSVIDRSKIFIVPNFSEDFLFVSDEEIRLKFSKTEKISILYLSNLLPGKGYEELAEAYMNLEPIYKEQVEVTFVGSFESKQSEISFLSRIAKEPNITYLGRFIDGYDKRKLYCKSHIFCLPTYYPYEGQPISILEAYATGCVVVTTNHSGIPFVFTDKVNGFQVEKKSVKSLRDTLMSIIFTKANLENIAIVNKNEALSKYRTSTFQNRISSIFNEVLTR